MSFPRKIDGTVTATTLRNGIVRLTIKDKLGAEIQVDLLPVKLDALRRALDQAGAPATDSIKNAA